MAEREKRRATTFRTSKGTIVNVQYPDIYVSPAFVSSADVTSPDEMREALREELDLHSAFTYESYMRAGVDAFFDARLYLSNAVYGAGRNVSVKASDFWKSVMEDTDIFTNEGTLTCPAAYGGRSVWAVALYSKQCYEYPYAGFNTRMPTLTAPQCLWLGFEMGGGVGIGIAGFLLEGLVGAYRLRVAVGGRPGSFVYGPVLTAALPTDFLTAEHTYNIRVTRAQTEFYIDSSLVAVAINSSNLAFSGIAYPPYAIWGSNIQSASKMRALIELAGQGLLLTAPLSPINVRFGPDSPLPPRVYRLYEAGTLNLFAGKSVAAGTLISHPVPIFGYEGKTLHFRANQSSTAGGLIVQTLAQTDNWRNYDALTYTANTDWFYTIAGESVLARLSYTPAAYPAVVAEGEAVLR